MRFECSCAHKPFRIADNAFKSKGTAWLSYCASRRRRTDASRVVQATTSARTAEGGNSVGNTPHSKRAGRQVRKREERRAKDQQPDADGSVKSKPKGKPGKRQRLAMREAAAAAKADTSAAEPKTKRTAKGATAGGAQQAAKGPLLVDAAEMAGEVKAGQVERQSRKRARRTSAVAAHG